MVRQGVSLEQMYSNWLLGYSSLLGPIAGIMAVDYFLIKKQRLDVPSLYMNHHAYPAVNIAGFIAFGVPVALTLLSLLTGTMNWFYDYGWFTGSALGRWCTTSPAVRWRRLPRQALCRWWPARRLASLDAVAHGAASCRAEPGGLRRQLASFTSPKNASTTRLGRRSWRVISTNGMR
ncbi:hypothetical protein HAALTHF_16290n [Vreelandella aquamarina]|nr:hypothetical protein HAALTHF_16290n [Halomonas axialensis]